MCEVLDLLVNFFNADNQGLPRDYLTSVDKYKELKKYCKLQTIDTSKLIHMYYQEMIAVQNSLKTSEYGQLFCRAYYHSKDEILVVEGTFFYFEMSYSFILTFYLNLSV